MQMEEKVSITDILADIMICRVVMINGIIFFTLNFKILSLVKSEINN